MDELDAEVQDVLGAEMQKRGFESSGPPVEIKLNEAKLNKYIVVQKLNQNFPFDFTASVVASLIGTVLGLLLLW